MVDQRFIAELTEAFKSQKESYELEAKKDLRDSEIVKAGGLDKWLELDSWVIENIEAANQRFPDLEYGKLERDKGFRVHRQFRASGLSAEVKLGSYDMSITVTGGRARAYLKFLPRVDSGQIVYTQGDLPQPNTALTYTIPEIGKKILRLVI